MKDNEILVRNVYDLTKIEEANIFKNTGIGIIEERGMETRDVAIQVAALFGIHNLELALACKGNMEIDGIFYAWKAKTISI